MYAIADIGLHFPHLALAFPVSCYRLVTNFQETNRQQETHARREDLEGMNEL